MNDEFSKYTPNKSIKTHYTIRFSSDELNQKIITENLTTQTLSKYINEYKPQICFIQKNIVLSIK